MESDQGERFAHGTSGLDSTRHKSGLERSGWNEVTVPGDNRTPRPLDKPRQLSPPPCPFAQVRKPKMPPRRACSGRWGDDGTLGAAVAGVGAFPTLLGDQALRPGLSISSAGGAAGRNVLTDLPERPFRLPPPVLGGGEGP
eukprot:bmy_02103T0